VQTDRLNHRLRHQRRLHGWTLEDVADGLHRMAGDATGVSVDAHMVGRWERGIRRPAPRYVRLLSLLFELPADQLGLVEEPQERCVWPAVEVCVPTTFAARITMTVAGCSQQCWIEGVPAP
jgi:transcriptional regulator with XRE-family HTH domain